MSRGATKPKPETVRCAMYTRVSTDQNLGQDFNSLHAQRESAEAYIVSMKHDGWELVPEHYDDGGFTGGNVERPALQRLLADIEAKKIDCVLVNRADRLSRSILDFAKLMEFFEQHGVAFVSVTQRFDTSNSMGRLTLNILMSFAQFEREMISERTRDKIAATRRRGKWSGGMPLLGYDVVNTKLVVLPEEAERVRQIFELYLELQSLVVTATALNGRGWKTKEWTTKKGERRGGLAFGKTKLHQMLTNVTYLGKIRYKDEVHEGEHEAIVDSDTFDRVQALLAENGNGHGTGSRNKHGALLTGLLRCGACNCGMVHTYTTKGNRRYRYYVCAHAQQKGWKACPAPSLPAAEIERFVIDQIQSIGRDPALVAATVAETRRQTDEAIARLKRERVALERQRRDDGAEGAKERRLFEIREEIARLGAILPTEDEVSAALAEFDAVWDSLAPREQAKAVGLLIDRIEYDATADDVAITFNATGLQTLEVAANAEETAA